MAQGDRSTAAPVFNYQDLGKNLAGFFDKQSNIEQIKDYADIEKMKDIKDMSDISAKTWDKLQGAVNDEVDKLQLDIINAYVDAGKAELPFDKKMELQKRKKNIENLAQSGRDRQLLYNQYAQIPLKYSLKDKDKFKSDLEQFATYDLNKKQWGLDFINPDVYTNLDIALQKAKITGQYDLEKERIKQSEITKRKLLDKGSDDISFILKNNDSDNEGLYDAKMNPVKNTWIVDFDKAKIKSFPETYEFNGKVSQGEADIESMEIRQKGDAYYPYITLSIRDNDNNIVGTKDVPYLSYLEKMLATGWSKEDHDNVRNKIAELNMSAITPQSTPQPNKGNEYGLDMDLMKSAFRSVESPKGKEGQEITSGRYKGEKAQGFYQMMPSNIKIWMNEVYNKKVKEDYVPTEEEQNVIFEHVNNKNLKSITKANPNLSEDDKIMLAAVWWYGNNKGKASPTKISDIDKNVVKTVKGEEYPSPYDHAMKKLNAYKGLKNKSNLQPPQPQSKSVDLTNLSSYNIW